MVAEIIRAVKSRAGNAQGRSNQHDWKTQKMCCEKAFLSDLNGAKRKRPYLKIKTLLLTSETLKPDKSLRNLQSFGFVIVSTQENQVKNLKSNYSSTIYSLSSSEKIKLVCST